MSELELLEQELRQQIDRRLEPGERTQLMKRAGRYFTLGFEFGKDWVRLREVKPSKKPPPVEPDQPDEAQVADQAAAIAVSAVATTVSNPSIPEDPWQEIDNGGFQLGEHNFAILQPETNGHWHLVADGQPVATDQPLDEAILTATQWLQSELQESRDAVEFARVQLEVMEDNATESAVAEQLVQITQLEQRREQLQAAADLITG